MLAVEKEIKETDLNELVRLQSDALRLKDQTISEMEEMLEKQAIELARTRRELMAFQTQMKMKVAV